MFNFFGDGGGGGGFPGHHHEQEEADTEKLYKTLNIAKDATGNDIKKAYRKMAMKHHPDKGGDANVFKEISKAYEILGDAEKRALYDKYGEKGVEQGGGGGGGMDPGDLFSSFFGGGGGGGGRRGPAKGKDVLFRLKVTLDDLYNGATKKLRLTKDTICKDCSGQGGKGVMKCTSCKGQGAKIIVRQIGPGMMQRMQVQCDECDGQGEIIPPGQRCTSCRGNKTRKEKKTLEVFVEKGMKHGQRVVFRGESDEAPGIQPGDVIVVLEQSDHDFFVRKGNHLFYKKKLTLSESLTGFTHHIQQMDGRVLKVASQEDTVYEPGCVKCVKEEGMPWAKNQYVKGNLYIEYEVEFPKTISAAARAALLKNLPKGAKEKAQGKDADIEEVMLENIDIRMEQMKWKQEAQQGGGQYDEDEGEGGPRQASCQAQ